MRAFYVVLAALAFVCKTNTVSATGQTKLSKLVETEVLTRSAIGHGVGNIRRRLGDTEAEVDDEDSGEERVDIAHTLLSLSKLDDSQLAKIFAAGKSADDYVSLNKLESLVNSKNLASRLKTEDVGKLLGVQTRLRDDVIDPTDVSRLFTLYEKDTAKMTDFITKLFPKWSSQAVNRNMVVRSMETHTPFNKKFIEEFADHYVNYVRKVATV